VKPSPSKRIPEDNWLPIEIGMGEFAGANDPFRSASVMSTGAATPLAVLTCRGEGLTRIARPLLPGPATTSESAFSPLNRRTPLLGAAAFIGDAPNTVGKLLSASACAWERLRRAYRLRDARRIPVRATGLL
jgi:hypothetical protein